MVPWRADVGIGPYGFMERLRKNQTADAEASAVLFSVNMSG